jgi:UDP:flavonoid glycosyltransferase YjiC (YdhE family)
VRILFASWPGLGHLLPMAPLIRAAQAAGHDVVVSSGAELAGSIEELGARAHRSGLTAAECYARLPAGARISALPPDEQAAFAARHLFGAGAVARARDLLDLVSTWGPDLVVHDTMELGSPVAAEAHGVPHVTHGYGPLMPGSGLFAAAIGAAIAEAGLPNPVPAVLAAPYLDICPPGLRTGERLWADVRPLQPSAGQPETDTTLAARIAGLPHPETVYVTLGTVMNQAPTVFRAVIDGAAQHPVNLVVTTGPGVDRAALEPLPESVLCAPYLPQATVLPRCSAVVSHAGAGTMLGALCHGLPQLCLPQSTDQPFNTAALLPTGAALALQPDQITAPAVAEALARLLGDPSFRQAAERLRGEIARMPPPDDVLPELAGLAGAGA